MHMRRGLHTHVTWHLYTSNETSAAMSHKTYTHQHMTCNTYTWEEAYTQMWHDNYTHQTNLPQPCHTRHIHIWLPHKTYTHQHMTCDTYTWDEATHTCDMTTMHIKWDLRSLVTQDIYTSTFTTCLNKLRRYVMWDIYTSSKTSAAILHATFAATFAHEGDQHNTNRFIHVCMLTQTDLLIYVQIRPMHMQRDLHTSTKKELNFRQIHSYMRRCALRTCKETYTHQQKKELDFRQIHSYMCRCALRTCKETYTHQQKKNSIFFLLMCVGLYIYIYVYIYIYIDEYIYINI